MSTVILHKFLLPIQDIKSKAELDLSGKELNHLDAILIAALLPLNVSGTMLSLLSLISLSVDKGAILCLDISNNDLNANSGRGMDYLGPAVASSNITSLNISNNYLFKNGGIEAVVSLLEKGGISSVNLLKNSIGVDQAKALVGILKEHPTLKSLCGNNGDETELHMSGKMHGAEDVIMLAAEIISNRAISSVNLLKNSIGIDQAKVLASILQEHPTLKSLCGNTGDETELDMSGKEMGVDGATMLAPEITGNGAILSLDMSSNSLNANSGRGMDYLGPAIASSTITSLNISKNCLFKNGGIEAVVSLLDKGALLVLSLKENNLLSKEAGKVLAKALAGNSTLKELDVSSNNWISNSKWAGDGLGFAQELAVGIRDNEALSMLNLADNSIGGYYDHGRMVVTPEGTPCG
jgi:hypothetical protein